MDTNYTFYIDDFAVELKQHLNLSEGAWITIEDDIKNFYDNIKNESLSGFLNKVFRNYYQSADATISLRIMEKINELESIIDSKKIETYDKKSIKAFVNAYIENYESELMAKARSYPKERWAKFRINKDNLDRLRESSEANYYEGSIGLYLKTIFEEYALKPLYVREQIFFNEILDVVQLAINRQQKLKITLNEKSNVKSDKKYCRKFLVSPYKVVQDKTKSYNYLIGYAEEIKETIINEDGIQKRTSSTLPKNPCCIRISRISKIHAQVSMGAHISKVDIAELDKMILERTPMFMSSEPIDITIRFTEKGLESFKRQLYMRPHIYSQDKDDNYVYHFRCSEVQAMNYFFKFGWDAQIIEPISLSNKFKQRYERSYKSYSGMTKEDIINSEESDKIV